MRSRVCLFSIVVFLLIMNFSCKKDTVNVSQSDALALALDDAIASDLFDDVLNETDAVVSDEESGNYASGTKKVGNLQGSRTVLVDKPDTVNFPKEITITYVNWVAVNGRTKNGIVHVKLSDRMWNANAKRTITFEEFTINGYKIEGTKEVTYKGKVAGKRTIEVRLTAGKIIAPDGIHYIERSFDRFRTQEAGGLTPLFIWDDVWSLSGSGSGKSRQGLSYQINIREPLYFKAVCPWITQGVLDIDIEGSKIISIDFGDGACDKTYQVTIDGQSTSGESVDGQQAP